MSSALRSERLIHVSHAPRHFPGRPSLHSVWRWCTKGVKHQTGERILLESFKVGHSRLTSREAIERFLAACNAPTDSVERAEQELTADGL